MGIIMWKKIDFAQQPPVHLTKADEVYYLREYKTPPQGVRYIETITNDLITNFKKPIDRQGKPEYKYKERAIEQMAEELRDFLPNAKIHAIPIPTSKCKNDVGYDNRLVQVLQRLKPSHPQIQTLDLFDCIENCQASHLGGSRNPDEIRRNLRLDILPTPCDTVVLVDDVLVTGAHFRACKSMIIEQCPQIRVVGAFWARAIR
ncbi:MAG TPA: hypothetical protein VK147_08500 [Candidatus Didemnitutus sp.]|nr:hypothetical protein [Candidatus Didemnitutus sp.]